MSLKRRFGGLVAANRRKRRITQQELADATGLSPDMISKIETGSTAVRFATIEKIADALQVDPSDLFAVSAASAEARPSLSRLIAVAAKLSDDELETARAILDAAFRLESKRTRVSKS